MIIDLDRSLIALQIPLRKNYIPNMTKYSNEFLKELSKHFVLKMYTKVNKIIVIQWLIKNNVDDFICAFVDEINPKDSKLMIDPRCFKI